MSKVSRPTAGANPGDVEGTHFAPPRGVRRIDLDRDGVASVPWALLELNPTGIQLRVFFALDAMCREKGRAWCIPGTRLFEREYGVKEQTARKALQFWERVEIIATQEVVIGGVTRTVIHCPWLFPDAWAGAVVEFGQGVGLDVDSGRRVSTAKPPREPKPRPTVPFKLPCVPRGAKCAPEGAPRSAPKEFESPEGERSNAKPCVAAFAFVGEPEEAPAVVTPPPAAPPEPAPPAPPDPEKVAELVASVRAVTEINRRTPSWEVAAIRLAYHELVTLGADLVPAELAADLAERFKAPPPPEPVRIKAPVAPAPPTTKALIYRLADPTGPAAVEEVCNRLARDLRSRPAAFAANVKAAASRAIHPDVLWEAFEQASGPGAKAPGAVFNAAVKRMRLGVPR